MFNKPCPVYFDFVLRAVANPENWEDDREGNNVLNWNYVDSDVYMALGPRRSDADKAEVDEHYRRFGDACTALEQARGEPFT